MKKTLKIFSLMLLMVMGVTVAACSDDNDKDDYVPSSELPSQAKTFLSTYYPNVEISYVNRETDKGKVQYEVTLASQDEVTFDVNGLWVDVEAPYGRAIPDGIALPAIVTYIADNHQGAGIHEISRVVQGYDVELTTGQEIIFSPDGTFLNYDY